ncbi:MAG: NADH-quinone oxidoreductase subunit NuoH [Ktedonobacteraceae bacterium]|nr:NADH-quinone oxidoreductase subunit NuoH [Ktedonobacteraceae bacterium]
MLEFLNNFYVATIIKSAIIIAVLLTAFAYMTLIERRVVAKLQGRLGPNRAGPFGFLQPLADALKMAFKEQIVPTQARKLIYLIAPVISVVIALSAFAVVPFGAVDPKNPNSPWGPVIADINVGLLWILSISSLAVYGIVLGGWSSGNRYSLLGSLRSAAQMVSYETSLGLALAGVLMWTSTLSLVGIVHYQIQNFWLIVVQPLGFFLYLIAGTAEVNRAPFDLPEAEQELTAGYLTEYSGLRWSLYQMAEYINMITVSAVVTTLYLGGWTFFGLERIPFLGFVFFVIKVAIFLFLFIWLRATLPRIRYDRLMRLGWQVLLPLSALNAVIAAVCVTLESQFNLPWMWVVNLVVSLLIIAIVFFVLRQKSIIEKTRFVEKAAQGAADLPASVRLVKFEATTTNGTTEAAAEEAKAAQA